MPRIRETAGEEDRDRIRRLNSSIRDVMPRSREAELDTDVFSEDACEPTERSLLWALCLHAVDLPGARAAAAVLRWVAAQFAARG